MVSQLGTLLSRRKRAEAVETEGIITSLERDFTVYVNHRPIYSSVEYRYRDRRGNWLTRRVAQMNSDLIARAGWRVGATVKVRYPTGDPEDGVIAA